MLVCDYYQKVHSTEHCSPPSPVTEESQKASRTHLPVNPASLLASGAADLLWRYYFPPNVTKPCIHHRRETPGSTPSTPTFICKPQIFFRVKCLILSIYVFINYLSYVKLSIFKLGFYLFYLSLTISECLPLTLFSHKSMTFTAVFTAQ